MSRKAKKPTSRGSRRPSKSTRRMSRNSGSVAKPAHRHKPEAEGVTLGMNAKKTTQRQGFRTSEFIVYPAHGVGQITAIEEQEVAGARLELFVINFVKDKMTLRVPTSKIASVGMRKLAETPMVKRALETLKGRARIKRTMWSRRAQEYEAKINSGDIVAIAEVVRDLFRSESQPEQSYSERQLYEAALDRLSREVAAVQRLTETEAVKEIEAALAKGPHRGPKPEVEEEAVVEEEAA
ncbi:MAG: CarD family transcriptional regulator [Xanthobacteraceae bacterium]